MPLLRRLKSSGTKNFLKTHRHGGGACPYQNLGWFVCGEPHQHEQNTGETYHYLCFCYKGKYYAACRSVEKTDADYEWEISAFCRELDWRKTNPSRIVSRLGARRLSKQHQSSKESKKWKK